MPKVYTNDGHMERLAISVEDMESNKHMDLCQGRIDLGHPFVAEGLVRKGANGKSCIYSIYAVEFTCSLLMAATICDIIRSRDRSGKKSTTRIYLYRHQWSRVPAGTMFTEKVSGNGEIRLVRKLFPVSSGPVVYNKPPKERPEPITFN